MAGLSTRPLDEADVAPLAALVGAPADLRAQLFDVARGAGRNVRVAARGAEVCGCVGWVDAPPLCYAAPFLAADREAAEVLLDEALAHAREAGAATIRTGADAGEHAKREALAAAGFTVALHFIDHVRPTGGGVIADLPWRRVAPPEIDAERLRDVWNETFAGVANAPPSTVEMVEEWLASPVFAHPATAAWEDDTRYVAFVLVAAEGDHATIDSIGVRDALRGRGVASSILDDVLARLPAEMLELRARIASTNTASLVLHTRKGFVERSRRTVFERGVLPEE